MVTKRQASWKLLFTFLLSVLLLNACSAPAAAPASGGAAAESASGGGHEQPAPNPADQVSSPSGDELPLPAVEAGKFNVAFLYVGPIGDGGWTDAQNRGRLYVAETMSDTVHTAYVASAPEGADAELIIRSLARQGFNAIFTTSFGFMDATATVAEEFPAVHFVNVAGFKKNSSNFANLFGAMESMNYLSGMIAGARAQADGSNRIGYIAPFPIPEVIRQANALALGMRKTCADCSMDIRWIFTWFDPTAERAAAQSLIDAGASVVVTGADTPGPVQVAGENGVYGIGYNSDSACAMDEEHCLTTSYWNWGPLYVNIIAKMAADSWQPDDIYFDVDSGNLGLLGFMAGQEPLPGVPADVIPQVRIVLDAMLAGDFTRFDVFAGPINNNKGEVVVPAGKRLTQSDLEGIDATLGAELGRDGCTYCMNWLAEGIAPSAEIPQ